MRYFLTRVGKDIRNAKLQTNWPNFILLVIILKFENTTVTYNENYAEYVKKSYASFGLKLSKVLELWSDIRTLETHKASSCLPTNKNREPCLDSCETVYLTDLYNFFWLFFAGFFFEENPEPAVFAGSPPTKINPFNFSYRIRFSFRLYVSFGINCAKF